MFSVVFTTETTGYKTGKEIEKNTYSDIQEGALAGRGTAHFFEQEELYTLLSNVGFKDIKTDVLRYTDRGSIIEEFLVQAQK